FLGLPQQPHLNTLRKYVAGLTQCLSDADWKIRRQAGLTLASLAAVADTKQMTVIRQSLTKALEKENNPTVRRSLRNAVSSLRSMKAGKSANGVISHDVNQPEPSHSLSKWLRLLAG